MARTARMACRALARGRRARLRPSGLGVAAFFRFESEGWWDRQDSNLNQTVMSAVNLQPTQGFSMNPVLSCARSYTFVHGLSVGFLVGGLPISVISGKHVAALNLESVMISWSPAVPTGSIESQASDRQLSGKFSAKGNEGNSRDPLCVERNVDPVWNKLQKR